MASAALSQPCRAVPQQRHRAARATRSVVCAAQQQQGPSPLAAVRAAGAGAAAAAAAAILLASGPASAELNRLEAQIGGEFGIGSAQQYGEADVKGRDFSNQDLRRANFTAADCRDCNFSNSNLSTAYFMKSVLARANFENADLSDTLMDRSVIVEANLRGAVLQRAVLTRSDLAGSDIYGADFTNALLDKTQQMALCKVADGVNPVTGESTRKSLNCGSSRRFKASSPSNPEGPQPSEEEKAAFNNTVPLYRR